MKPKQPPDFLMTLGNMRDLGVRVLAISCLNPDCQHQTVLSVDDYPDDLSVPSFGPRSRKGAHSNGLVDVL